MIHLKHIIKLNYQKIRPTLQAIDLVKIKNLADK